MKLVVATNNDHKVMELKRILEPFGYEVTSQKELGIDLEVEETGTTFQENAYLKAKALYDLCGEITVADDSGLVVDYLEGAPGIYSARFGGPDLTSLEQCQLILKKMDGVPTEKRTARFVSAVCIVFSETDSRTYTGTCEGFIGTGCLGDQGFGYDPIFMVNETESFATLDGNQKDAMSHRGNALRQLQQDLCKEKNRKEF